MKLWSIIHIRYILKAGVKRIRVPSVGINDTRNNSTPTVSRSVELVECGFMGNV